MALELMKKIPRYNRRTIIDRLKFLEWIGIVTDVRKPHKGSQVCRRHYYLVPLNDLQRKILNELQELELEITQ